MADVLTRRLNGGTSLRSVVLTSQQLKLAGLDVWTIGEYQVEQLLVAAMASVSANGRSKRSTGWGNVIGSWDELALLQDGGATYSSVGSTAKTHAALGRYLMTTWITGILAGTGAPCMNVTRGQLTAA